MKKIMKFILPIFLISMVGCSNKEYSVSVNIPPNTKDIFVFSDEEVTTKNNKITITSGENLPDTEVMLKDNKGNYLTSAYISKGMIINFDAEKDVYYKIGVKVDNTESEELRVFVNVKNANIRIE